MIHPYYAAVVRKDLAAFIKGKAEDFECEYRIRHRDGSYRWVMCRGQAIRDEHGVATEISGVQTDVTRLIETRNGLIDEAIHDRLTGLPNRGYFTARLEQAIDQQRRDPAHRFAVLFLDLDRFKEVNDTLGHLVGDELLAATATRIHESLRPADFVARFGGDEFVILLERAKSRRDAELIASRILQSLGKPHRLDGHKVVVNASIGIVLSDPKLTSAEMLIRNADIAMYQAKSDCKSSSKHYVPVMYDRIERSWRLENELRGAIERDELALVYQPQVCSKTGKILGAEALLRRQRDDGEPVEPREFIPLAEKSDLILDIGEWVLRQACEEAVRWENIRPRGTCATKISVNLSALQLLQSEFPSLVERIVAESGVDPRTLELELTESVLVDSMQRVPGILTELSQLGTKLAIDDFGTGYSSMSYLRDLMPDVVKIDRSFVVDVGNDRSAAALAKGMIGLAHDLGLTVVAEGVEDNQQLTFFQRHNCDLIQGFYASRPLPPETFQKLLHANQPLTEGRIRDQEFVLADIARRGVWVQ